VHHGMFIFVRAGVVDPFAGVQKGRAHQVRGARGGAQGLRVSRVAIPEVQGSMQW